MSDWAKELTILLIILSIYILVLIFLIIVFLIMVCPPFSEIEHPFIIYIKNVLDKYSLLGNIDDISCPICGEKTL